MQKCIQCKKCACWKSLKRWIFSDFRELNEVIDLHAERMLVGMRSRIPLVIWIGLFGLAMLGMAAVGYQSALWATRRLPVMLALVLAFSVALLLIADLDREHEGLLRAS